MNVISPDDLAHGLVPGFAPDSAQGSAAHSEPSSASILSGILPIYKEWGETPLQALDRIRVQYPVLEKATLSYAGRLDPLAEGLMLILVGEANKRREEYLGLDKTYEVEVLLGVATDTGDIFGIPKADMAGESNIQLASRLGAGIMNEIENRDGRAGHEEILNAFLGKHQFDYPLYSSKTVQGKPLHQWVNEGRAGEIEIPKTNVEIFSIENLGMREIYFKEILEKVQKAVSLVKGDFRFEQIEQGWKNLEGASNEHESKFAVLKIECSCSSGTYMRTLAEEIGKKLGTLALAYSIKRTKVGNLSM